MNKQEVIDHFNIPISTNCPGAVSVEFRGEKYEFRIANTFELREAAYRFTYATYRDRDLGESNPAKLWYSLDELMPKTVTLLMTQNNNIIASVSMVCDSERYLPADDIYSNQLNKWRNENRKMIEVCSLSIHPVFRKKFHLLGKLFSLIYCTGYFALDHTHLIITVMPNHVSFYKNQLCFDEVDEVGYHAKTGVNCLLLSLDLMTYFNAPQDVIDNTFLRFYHSSQDMAEIGKVLAAGIRPMDLSEFIYFISKRPELISKKGISDINKLIKTFNYTKLERS